MWVDSCIISREIMELYHQAIKQSLLKIAVFFIRNKMPKISIQIFAILK